jgi:hypothetical protein
MADQEVLKRRARQMKRDLNDGIYEYVMDYHWKDFVRDFMDKVDEEDKEVWEEYFRIKGA